MTGLQIADFDLAATQEERRESQNEIWHSTPCGTFSYSAPEVVAGDTYVPALVDVSASWVRIIRFRVWGSSFADVTAHTRSHNWV